MKGYTRTGDRGKTGLYGGTRVGKENPRVEAYGAVDELNSQIGLARAIVKDAKIRTPDCASRSDGEDAVLLVLWSIRPTAQSCRVGRRMIDVGCSMFCRGNIVTARDEGDSGVITCPVL